jgi:hypothetical protein
VRWTEPKPIHFRLPAHLVRVRNQITVRANHTVEVPAKGKAKFTEGLEIRALGIASLEVIPSPPAGRTHSNQAFSPATHKTARGMPDSSAFVEGRPRPRHG